MRCAAAGDLVTIFPLPPTHFPGFLGLLLPHPGVTHPDVAAASGLSLQSSRVPDKCFCICPPNPGPPQASRPPASPSIPGPGEGRERRLEEEGRPPLPHRQRRPQRGRSGPLGSRKEGPSRPGLTWGRPVAHF